MRRKALFNEQKGLFVMVKNFELVKLMAITGMKNKELAKIIGVSQQAASKKIKGETEFKQSEMKLITGYFKKLQSEDKQMFKNYPLVTMDLIFYEGIND